MLILSLFKLLIADTIATVYIQITIYYPITRKFFASQ